MVFYLQAQLSHSSVTCRSKLEQSYIAHYSKYLEAQHVIEIARGGTPPSTSCHCEEALRLPPPCAATLARLAAHVASC